MSAQVCRNCTAAYSIGAPRCPQCGANTPLPADGGPDGPSVRVRCPGRECPQYGVERVVPLRLAAPGVVERPPLHCAACDRKVETVQDDEKGDDGMPKITVHGGASDATFDDEGGEQSSPTPDADGTTSSTSSEKASNSPETSESGSAKPARTTGSRSKRGQTGSSTAPGTDGGQTAPTSKTDGDA